jgi:ribosomal protein L29
MASELKSMNEKERENKLKELKMELIKSKVGGAKTGTSRIKEIKKMIARILTLNKVGENKK